MSAGLMVGRCSLLVLRIATAGVFLVSAFAKLSDPGDFWFAIKRFALVPEHMLDPLAFIVPWIEAACAVALVIGLWGRAAAVVLGGMLLFFIAAILSVLFRGMEVECGCFGDYSLLCEPAKVGWCNIGQNALLFAIALPVMLWGPGILSLDSLAARLCCGDTGGGSCGGKAGAKPADLDSRQAAS